MRPHLHLLSLLLVLGCSGDGAGADKDDPADGVADADADADADSDADSDADADADSDADADADSDADSDADADADSDTDSDADTDTGTTNPTGSGLPAGFESTLTDQFGCFGDIYAMDAAGEIALEFSANDLAGYAFVNQLDTVDTFDLAVDGSRLTVYTGSALDAALCNTGTGVIETTWTAASGTAVLSIWPHNAQQEQTEGELELTSVVLEAPNEPDYTIGSFLFPRQQIGGLP